MKDLTVVLDDEPGSLADLGEATGGANINIEGMCATTAGGKGEIHIWWRTRRRRGRRSRGPGSR
jgi:hypothetical protein